MAAVLAPGFCSERKMLMLEGVLEHRPSGGGRALELFVYEPLALRGWSRTERQESSSAKEILGLFLVWAALRMVQGPAHSVLFASASHLLLRM